MDASELWEEKLPAGFTDPGVDAKLPPGITELSGKLPAARGAELNARLSAGFVDPGVDAKFPLGFAE